MAEAPLELYSTSSLTSALRYHSTCLMSITETPCVGHHQQFDIHVPNLTNMRLVSVSV